MKRRMKGLVLFLGISLFPGIAFCIDCSGLPTQFDGDEFPSGNFFTNFNTPCYTIPFATGKGQNGLGGDLNTKYRLVFFKVDPRYELIILGTFPNARAFSITAYDEHSAISEYILDTNIVPLTARYTNPYLPGTAFLGGQQFAVPVGFGGTPGTIQTGCNMNGFSVAANKLNATRRHQGMDWNSDTGLFGVYPQFALHVVDTPQHTNPNTAGAILIRTYLDITHPDRPTSPQVIVRDVASGCAYPAAYALNTLQIITNHVVTGNSWLATSQIQDHFFYANQYLPKLCYATDPQNHLAWLRGTDYVPEDDPDSSYIVAYAPAGLPASLATAGRVLRLRFRIPATPPTPCTSGCSRSGTEELRYMSLSFENSGAITLTSLADSAFTKDSNGYVTLVVGTGAAIPAWITAANGYTFLDLTSITGYDQLNSLALRNVLPAGNFNCAGKFIPYRTGEHTPVGGLIGEYLPEVDYPVATSLPRHATPFVQQNSCGIFPAGQSGVYPNCGVFTPPPISILSVATQCAAPACNQVVAQAQPPLTITGGGFGDFPNGLPYTGNSNYLEITNSTKNWSAGYGTDLCNVSISDWASNNIQLVANVNQNGLCPLAAGDHLTVKVWNPQTMSGPASFPIIVAAH